MIVESLWREAVVGKDWKSYLNFIISQHEKKGKKQKLFSKPYLSYLDPVSYCNLQCPFCETGRRIGIRESARLSLDKFKHILDHIGPYLFELYFYNWGEPLLNNDLPEMIRYARKFSIFTRVSSNLSIPLTEKKINDIVSSGLDFLLCSIDGASQETYEKYRAGGNFELVMKNLEMFLKSKKELSSNKPYILWRFFVFKHNENEIEIAKKMASNLGVPISFGQPFIRDFANPEDWISTMPEFSKDVVVVSRQVPGSDIDYVINKGKRIDFPLMKTRPCDWLWSTMTINATYSVSPCCTTIFEKDDFGKISNSINKFWNNEKYQGARAFFKDGQERSDIICTRCPTPYMMNAQHQSDERIWRLFWEKSPVWLRGLYRFYLKCECLLKKIHLPLKWENAISCLIQVYDERIDLQKTFPEVKNNNELINLIDWAGMFGFKEDSRLEPYEKLFKKNSHKTA